MPSANGIRSARSRIVGSLKCTRPLVAIAKEQDYRLFEPVPLNDYEAARGAFSKAAYLRFRAAESADNL